MLGPFYTPPTLSQLDLGSALRARYELNMATDCQILCHGLPVTPALGN